MSYWNKKLLEIVFWDVQHGNAIYIKTPNDKTIIQDLGVGNYSESSINFSPLNHIKTTRHIYSIDHLILTHPHLDHIEDILNLDLFRVNTISYPNSITEWEIQNKINTEVDPYKKSIYKKYLHLIENSRPSISNGYNPFLLSYYGGLEIKIYAPKPSVEISYKENEHSLVTFISYAGYKILLSGDNGVASWKYLLNNQYFRNDLRDNDIFLASHHGRKSGFHEPLFRFFIPKLTIISDGSVRETSITDIYNSHTKGLFIKNQRKKRKCLTTRFDGAIYLRIGYNLNSYPFLNVRTQYK